MLLHLAARQSTPLTFSTRPPAPLPTFSTRSPQRHALTPQHTPHTPLPPLHTRKHTHRKHTHCPQLKTVQRLCANLQLTLCTPCLLRGPSPTAQLSNALAADRADTTSVHAKLEPHQHVRARACVCTCVRACVCVCVCVCVCKLSSQFAHTNTSTTLKVACE